MNRIAPLPSEAMRNRPPSSNLVISLDFELFWGVSDSRTVEGYGRNIEGAWDAIPRLLMLFRRYGVKASWATVGMLMCRDYAQWRDIRPTILPGYIRQQCSTYLLASVSRDFPKLFFARPLVEQILATPGQELATHTYSHFYCGEDGATPEQFSADLACAREIATDIGVACRSLVFPRNQVRQEFVAELDKAGIHAYRGNSRHGLYRDGHVAPGGVAGRALRFVDSWLPLTGVHTGYPKKSDRVMNVPGSFFLRPWSRRLAYLEPLRMVRLKNAMTTAARSNGTFHIWWHPHNFGINLEQNLAVLESLLQHYWYLRDHYGMGNMTMGEVAEHSGEVCEHDMESAR